ncbi:MAG TPA: phenylacetate--CoA ligase [Candidatus Olsenella excrementigallinarum]|uniref:phenylacetate--CoA ligase family protein n=1 Tax=Olsenella timonensis TaxID=1805478 RepID=UPI00094EE352|nr:phenylacetate--CoA ligase [Olsenella timonensis]HJB48803.1 phenylacetate--CoA ligase [Candidatus Olsenella excrementigallinarum]
MRINESQLKLVNSQVQRLVASGNYFGRRLQEAGVTEVLTEGDFLALPFSEKEDLRNCYPLGVSAVDEREIVRIHSSSGTTGTPVIIPYTAKDVDDWAEQFRRCYELAGITSEDRIQITPGYGLWTAGIGFQAGAEKLGAMAVPMGPGNTEKQLQFMVDLKTTVIGATSSYALLLAEEVERRGMRDQIALRKGVIGSERWGKKMRDRVKAGLGIDVYDIYGLTEVYGPGIGISCDAEDGMHYWDDYLYIEIVDPATGEPLPDGEWGEIVITTLVKEGAPLIRFRTHDLSRIIPGECPCGSPFPRIDSLQGRSDDMVKIHGVNVFPRQIEEILQTFPALSSEYQIRLSHLEGRDTMRIYVETDGTQDFLETADAVAHEVKRRVGFTPLVKVVELGVLPRSEKKTRRVFDERYE